MDIQALTLEIFTRLMREDTINPPGNELRGARCLQEIFSAHGIDSQVQNLGHNRGNFICTLGQKGPMLEFCGHLDVVPAAEGWRHPPLGTTEEQGLLYGRGACDMKGGVAAMCAAAIGLAPEIEQSRMRLRLAFVADEEQANAGMHAFLGAYPSADYTILGEPTDLHVAIAHRGVARLYIDLHGQARHAALRSSEETAVTKAARAVLAMDRLNARLKKQSHPILPAPSISVTQISGYEKDNVVPGKVRILVDFRILPGMEESSVQGMLEKALKEEAIDSFTLHPHFFMPGGALEAGAPFVSLCCQTASDLNGRREVPQAFDASCEQCFLLQAGPQTVILGPGSLAQAHTTDECVEKTQLFRAAQIYMAVALRMMTS